MNAAQAITAVDDLAPTLRVDTGKLVIEPGRVEGEQTKTGVNGRSFVHIRPRPTPKGRYVISTYDLDGKLLHRFEFDAAKVASVVGLEVE